MKYVSKLTYISKEEALETFSEDNGSQNLFEIEANISFN